LIAAGLSPFAPETQNDRAGRLLLERFRELVSQKADFGFETTLSGRTYVKLLGNMKAHGYRVVLFFLWLPSAEMAIARVESRVKQGGTTFLLRPFGDDMRLVYEIYSVSITRNAMNYGC
jgi:predicted ABC-type ATPase